MDARDHQLALKMLAALGLGLRSGGVVLDRGVPFGRVVRAGEATRLVTLSGRMLAVVQREPGGAVMRSVEGVILHRFKVQ